MAWDVDYAADNNANWYANWHANWYAYWDGDTGGAFPLDYPVMAASLDRRAWGEECDKQMQLLEADVAKFVFEATFGIPYEPWDNQQNTKNRNAGISPQHFGLPHDISSGEGYSTRRMSDTVAGKYLFPTTRAMI